jgi:hypothetical protein
MFAGTLYAARAARRYHRRKGGCNNLGIEE